MSWRLRLKKVQAVSRADADFVPAAKSPLSMHIEVWIGIYLMNSPS